MRRFLFYFTLCVIAVGCKSELTKESAMEAIVACEEFKEPFYAPFHTGSEVLSGDKFKNSNRYIEDHLGPLIQSGLVNAKIKSSNSWRSVLEITLTEKGLEMADTSRSTKQNKYVRACTVVVLSVDSIRTITADQVLEVDFTFKEQDVTPFGQHLGLVEGRTHKDSRRFVRDGLGWKVEIL